MTDDIDAEGDTAAGTADRPPGPPARVVMGAVEDAAAANAAAAVAEEGIDDEERAVEGWLRLDARAPLPLEAAEMEA